MIKRPGIILLISSQILLVLFAWQQWGPQEQDPVAPAPVFAPEPEQPLPDDQVGRPLPDISLQGPDGPVRLRDLRGPLVLEFISTSCPYCQKMAPIFDRVMRGAPARFLVVGVGSETLGSVRRWHEERLGSRMPGSYAMDRSGRAVTELGLQGTPTTIFIDRSGDVRFFLTGEFSEEELRQLIRQTVS